MSPILKQCTVGTVKAVYFDVDPLNFTWDIVTCCCFTVNVIDPHSKDLCQVFVKYICD
jgi:hypothetical protein